LDLGIPLGMILAAGFASLFSLVGALLGVQRTSWSRAGLQETYDLGLSTLLATLISLAVNNFLPASPWLPNAMLLVAASLAFVGFIGVRYRVRILQSLAIRWLALRKDVHGINERVLIVGSGESGHFAAWLLGQRSSPATFKVVGFVDDDLYKQGARIRSLNVLGRSEDIPHLVREHDIGLIIFAIHNIAARERQRLLRICSSTTARLVDVPDVLGRVKQMIASPAHDDARFINRSQAEKEGTQLSPEALSNRQIPCDQVDAWLSELLEISDQGDMEALQKQIHTMRVHLQTDSALRVTEWTEKTSDKQL
jgi:FlaA1/EpsC-like NDP-sugar epimerase